MSVILVLEQDAGYAGRISSVLRAAGHEVHVVQSMDHALQIAASRPPQLFLASGSNAGAADLLDRFARRRGGPGSVVLLPSTLAEQVQAADYRADEILTKPFTESDLQALARRFLSAAPAPQPPAAQKSQLTSADIFGDVLAEVEAEAQKSAAVRRSSSRDDVSKKLEETLAGVYPMADRPRPAATAPASPAPAGSLAAPPAAARPAAPPPGPFSAAGLAGTGSGLPPGLAPSAEAPRRTRPQPPSADEIDDLLDKTLSSLELPRRRPAAPPAPAPPVAPSAPVSPFAAPPSPRPSPPPAAPAYAPPAAPTYAPPAAAPSYAVPMPQPAATAPPFAIPAPAPIAPAPATAALAPSSAGSWSPQAFGAPPAPQAFGAPPAQLLAAASPASEPVFTPPPALDLPSFGSYFGSQPSYEPARASEPQPVFESVPAFEALPAFDALPVFEPVSSFEPGAAIPEPAPFEPFPPPSGNTPAPFTPAADLWAADMWSSDSFGSGSHEAPASSPVPFAAPGESPGSGGWAAPAESYPRLEMPPRQPPPSWGPATPDDTGWSVASFDDLPTPKLSSIPEPARAGAEGSSPPADFLSAFAPPSETGSFVKPLPRGREDGQLVSTSDFGLAQEADPGLRATLDGVLQIRGEHAAGRHEGELDGSPFGDYRLMERVAIGGMAEVWRARRRGVEGFQKTVAIKKILGHLTGSVDFVTMFIDEAKLAAQLSHNNIIQIYDLGKVDDDFYIAMEYVEGWDLRTILSAARERGLPLPLPLALAICAAVARALDYAHRKRDFANRALGLVHRDVSPQNVLISHEGEIKLCDFGIVKAVSKASTTQMGALKGKLQYMSPEQAWGREVDARSDIFSLGSVLFEVLTGTKLFTGDSEIGVLDAVRDCRVRSPREIDPRIPEEVERIVQRSLAKNPEDRYQTAGQLEKDLIAVLDGMRLTPGQRDMADYLGQLFNTPLLRHDARGGAYPQAAYSQAAFPPEAHASGGYPPPAYPSGPPSGALPATQPAAPLESRPEAAKSKGGLLALAALLLMLVLFLAWFFLLREKPADGPPADPAPVPPASSSPADGAPTEGAPEGGAAAEGAVPGAAPAAAGSSEVVRQLVNEQLDARQKEIERDFDEKRRKLEEELARVQRENNRPAPRPNGGGNR